MSITRYAREGVVACLVLCWLVVLGADATAATAKGRARAKRMKALIKDQVKVEANNLRLPVTNFAVHGQDVTGGVAGAEWPKNSGNFYIFGAGPYIGATLPGGRKVVSVGYNPNDGTSEFGPGAVVGGASTDPDQDLAPYHIYKITPASRDLPAGDPGRKDYDEWPVADGAPVGPDGKPLIVSDEDTWCVYNDANFDLHSGVNQPGDELKIEVQQRTFAFIGAGPVNDIVFLSYKFINKSARNLSDVYMGMLVDPDLGDFSDDLAGCDITRSIGFIYNANAADAHINGTPGVVAYDYFKGPIDASGNQLGMTAFTIFTIANDPTTDEERYNLMAGLQKDGTARPGGRFDFPGDATDRSDPDVDITPADKRFMISSGPFQMAVGDTQTIVIGVIAAAGAENFDGVRAVKNSDEQAQTIFDKDFKVPGAPANPKVTVNALNNQIVLTWDDTPEFVVDTFGRGLAGYDTLDFQGYRVYKSLTPNPTDFVLAADADGNPAQYDKADGVTNVTDNQLDPSTGFTQTIVLKIGKDTGLRHYFVDNNVTNGHTYYYDVRSYDYQPTFQPRTLERTSPSAITAMPMAPFGRDPSVVKLFGQDTTQTEITGMHTSGTSDGSATIRLINPNLVTGHAYEVQFVENPPKVIAPRVTTEAADADELRVRPKPTVEAGPGETAWKLVDKTTSQTVLSNQAQSSAPDDLSGAIVDGLLVTVAGPSPGINADNPWSWGPTPGSRWMSGSSAIGLPYLFGALGLGTDLFGSAITAGKDFVTVEIRFAPLGTPGKTQLAYDYVRRGTPGYGYEGYFEVPFTVWDVDAEPDRQLNCAFIENKPSPQYDHMWDPTDDFTDREFLAILKSTYSSTPDPFYTTVPGGTGPRQYLTGPAGENLVDDGDILYNIWPIIRPGHTFSELADGHVFRITANHVNTTSDAFVFKTQAPTAGAAVEQAELGRIKAVPNPYIVRNALENSPFQRQIQFTHLPSGSAASPVLIEIYTLAGDLIKTIRHVTNTSIETWDVLTDNGLPPASGVYIFRVESAKGTKMGKLAIIMGRTILQVQ